MKKIPTLFERTFDGHNVVGITDKVYEGMEWVLKGEGTATIKYDGSCVAIFDGVYYKRFDAKPGRTVPEGAIPCCDPDPVTGHHPHWVRVTDNPADKWYVQAFINTDLRELPFPLRDGTYEVVGPHFQGNPYKLSDDKLIRHGKHVIDDLERTFEGIRSWLKNHHEEGIVFWKDGEPQCKIKRTDFGFEWNGRNKK